MSNKKSTKRIKPVHLYLIMMIVSSVVFTVFLVLSIILVYNPGFFGSNTYNHNSMIFIFTSIMMVGLVGMTLSLKVFVNQIEFAKQLRIENSYTLGTETTFYNLSAFKDRVNKLKKRLRFRKKEEYLVAFTATSYEISYNRHRNNEVILLNQKLAVGLAKLFEEERNEYAHRDCVYAFNRGIFYIYLFVEDREAILKFINDVTSMVFKIASEEKLKVWAQPFFGIKEVTSEDSITTAIENAMVARDTSENNYESYTIYAEVEKDAITNDIQQIVRAVQNNEFIPYYQMKYSLNEKRFISCEALARWNSPTMGILTPSRFIERAEQAGLLPDIDIQIFMGAVKDISENIRRGRRTIPVSCNFSLYEFFSRNFFDVIMNTLKQYQVPTKYIEIEITESTTQVNQFLSLSVIKKLKEAGIRVLMDDFGVGYSQIAALNKIPYDAIKIDKSFTDYIVAEEKTRSIVKLLVDLAHTNGMEAIVEGVETKEQLDILRKMKVDTIQGFYFTKAVSVEDANNLLKHNTFEKEVKAK